MNQYYKNLLAYILQGEQPQLKEVIEDHLEDDIENFTIKELLIFMEDNMEHLNNFIQ